MKDKCGSIIIKNNSYTVLSNIVFFSLYALWHTFPYFCTKNVHFKFIYYFHILLNNIFDIEEKYESQLIFLPLIEDASLSLPVWSCSWKTLSITWRTFSVIIETSSGVVPSVGMGFSTLTLMIPAQMKTHNKIIKILWSNTALWHTSTLILIWVWVPLTLF